MSGVSVTDFRDGNGKEDQSLTIGKLDNIFFSASNLQINLQ